MLRKFYLQDLKMVLLVKIHGKHDLSAGKFRTKRVLVTKLSQTYCLSQSCRTESSFNCMLVSCSQCLNRKRFKKTMYGNKNLICKSKLDPSYSNNTSHYMGIGIMVHILMLLCIAIPYSPGFAYTILYSSGLSHTVL